MWLSVETFSTCYMRNGAREKEKVYLLRNNYQFSEQIYMDLSMFEMVKFIESPVNSLCYNSTCA